MNAGAAVFIAMLSGGLWLAHAQTLNLENTSLYIGNGRWEWTLYVTGNPKVLNDIKCVEYQLHPTFPNPVQTVCQAGAPDKAFALNGSGWGEFNVQATVKLARGSPLKLSHWLKLAPTNRPPICPIAATQTVVEHNAWTLPPPKQNIHIYVEEIHQTRASHIAVINTLKAFDKTNVDWSSLKRDLREVKSGVLVSDTYRLLSLRPQERVSIRLPGKTDLNLFVDYPSRHGTLEIDICQ